MGATDLSADQAGKDLGIVLGLGRKLRIKVDGNPEKFIRKSRADVAVLCTSSSLKTIKPQLLGLIQRGMHVVTTCEELAFPVPEQAAAWRDIDKAAAAKKVSVLATGVNPGYAMDALALMLTAPCAEVTRVSITRVVDARTRRLPLQRKVGAGLNLNQFRRAMTEGTVRHVGLPQSVHMIAAALGWKLDRVDETLEPAIAPRDLDTEYLRIPAGAAAGIKQYARGYRNGDLAVSLDLQMYVGAEAPRDHILIDGTPPIDVTIAGGVAGDIGTAAIVVNSIPKLMAARPGFVTMKDLPLVHRLNPLELRSLPPKPR
ncbi:MAG TPA: dihydrodipicolinate reductase [Vicinamibacteria bacterium]